MKNGILTFYYPSLKHTTLSVTGRSCALDCKHCGGKYLKNMTDVSTVARFREELNLLKNKGIEGILLSGGCDIRGRVPLGFLKEDIGNVVSSGKFKVNVHVGFLENEDVRDLKEMGIQNVCVDVVGDVETIQKVYGLEHVKPVSSLELLRSAGFDHIIPHITVGLDNGSIGHEQGALELCKNQIGKPEKIIFLSLIPTPGTSFEHSAPVKIDDFLSIVNMAKKMFPDTELILGCMRAHLSSSEINRLIGAGISGIVNPPRDLGNMVESGKIIVKESCCSF